MRFPYTAFQVLTSLNLLTAYPISPPRLVFLDRDGVINHDVGPPGVLSISQFDLIDHAATAIGALKRLGCTVVMVTNQSCVGKGIISRRQLDDIHDHMIHQLHKGDPDAVLDKLFVCTCTPEDDARCKPNPGMIFEALQEFQIDPADCVLVGDTVTDLQAAESLPMRILVATGYGTRIMGRDAGEEPECITTCPSLPESILPFYFARNLGAAVDFIRRRSRPDKASDN
ncbi:HAD-hyrolase-like protein [Fragilaria crotonensis]|nr:HAD-hyrolase-like protein [Fragilaria crotonensis]